VEQVLGPEAENVISLISHELNTPLTTILGNAHFLRSHGETLPETDKRLALEDLESSAERLSKALQNLLLLARLELNPVPVGEPVVVGHFLEMVASSKAKPEMGRVLETRIDAIEAPVVADSDHLKVALNNLLDNAFVFGGQESPVELTACQDGERVLISVLDRGPGIDEEDWPAVFQPFYRSAKFADSRPGLGIGLTVSQKLAQLHGGAISYARREGGGSEFQFSLPVVTPEVNL
jgi:signal transduction histidine kinase